MRRAAISTQSITWQWTVALLLLGATAVTAQPGPPKAQATPLVETDGVHAGSSARVALRVRLPEGVHVQADRPRDPSLIPTILALEPPAGITVAEIVYPEPTDLKQAGQQQPLAVFGRNFTVGVRLTLGRALSPGALIVPARLRYQACDSTACFAPAQEETRWTLRIVPAGTPTPVQNAELFKQIRFGRPSSSPAAK
jgi:DsbC/DsbD-like thiol-disulfide interchange protein